MNTHIPTILIKHLLNYIENIRVRQALIAKNICALLHRLHKVIHKL